MAADVPLCSECGEPIRFSQREAPKTCWRLICVALGTWGPEEWRQQARFAQIRWDCGLKVDALGRMALDRAA